ncbi:MAG: IclR family transcriptional regulator [Burkholderiales bacterium]|nr:IclR family transcriptional regulator [Burkholderiales bacterium]
MLGTPSPIASLRPALVPAVVRAMAVLDHLARQRQPLSMARLAVDLALPKSSVHGLCNTLLALGYLRRQGDGQLQIGPRVMGLAEAFLAGTDVTREFDALWQAEQAPDETVLLSVLDGPDVVYLAARNGSRPLGLAFNVGMRLPAHLASTGKAMLAWLPPAAVRQRLGSGPLARLTAHGPADLDALAAELAATRARGYSIDDEGIRLGVYCLAAPVLDAGGRPVAGVGVCMNKATLHPDETARQRERVLDTARALSQRLGGLPATPREDLAE